MLQLSMLATTLREFLHVIYLISNFLKESEKTKKKI